MIRFKHKGNFSKTTLFFERLKNLFDKGILDEYGRRGVAALSAATPSDTGITANSWAYQISNSVGKMTIEWTNSNINEGVNIAVIIQYGHGTGTGGYVKGRDYINPAMQPIFDAIVSNIWKEVTRK